METDGADYRKMIFYFGILGVCVAVLLGLNFYEVRVEQRELEVSKGLFYYSGTKNVEPCTGSENDRR